MTQQETGELLASLTQAAYRRQTGANKIADRLMRLVGNPDGGQFTGSVQLSEVDRIPPVSFDPVARSAEDQRRRNDHASMFGRRQLSLDPVPARSGFVTEPQFAAAASQFYSHRHRSGRRVCDHTVRAYFSSLTSLSKRDRNRILVYVQTDVGDMLAHDLSPMH
jgi:hypothetical protein